MPFVAGSDGTITVGVDADASAAADELETKLSAAVAEAMKDPKIAAAISVLIKEILKSTQALSKSSKKAYDDLRKSAQQAAKSMTDAFNQVGKAARTALRIDPGGANAGIGILERNIVALTENFDELKNASKEALRVIEEIGRSSRTDVRARQQQLRDETSLATQQARTRSATLQAQQNEVLAASRREVATIRATAQITAAQMRQTLRIIELTWRSATQVVRAFANTASALLRGFATGAAAALRGLGRVTSSIFQGMQRTAAASFRGMTHLFATFGRGLISALQGVSRAFASALHRDESALRSSLHRRESAVRASQQRTAALFSGGAIAGLAGGAGIVSLLTSGFQRLGQEEQLQLTFTALLDDGQQAAEVLQQLSDFARTTAFDFVEVAGSVAQLTATLGDVDQAIDLTTFLADVTALTGGTTEALGRVRLAMSQIAGAGRLDSANLRQLTESLPGVPFAQILADRFFGGDVQAYSAARDAGELGATVSAQAFFDAFEQGVKERFPQVEGFAQVAATTVSGLAANLKENFAIFGATLVGVAEGPIKSFIGRVNEALGVLGQFVQGTGIFGAGGAGAAGAGAINPFTGTPFNVTIPFEELPQEMQDILAERNGWGPNEGFVLAAQHAEQLWEELHPPPELEEGTNRLRELRDVVISFARGAGLITALAVSLKLLGAALNFVFRPSTLGPRLAAIRGLLLLGTVGGVVGVAFAQIYKASKPLRDSLTVLRETLGPLGESLKNLGGSVLEGLFRLFGDESTQSGLERIGGFLSGIVNTLSRGAAHLTEWINWASEMIDAGKFSAVLDDLKIRLRDFVDNIPFVGDLVDRIFGDDDEGRLTAIEERIFGVEKDERNIGQRILDRLEDTFLGPVIRFFRGPFADLVERIAGGFADFGGFLGDIFNAIFGDDPGGIGTRVLDVLEGTFLGPVVRFFREGGLQQAFENVRQFFAPAFTDISNAVSAMWRIIQPIAQPILDWFTEIIEMFRNLDFSDLDLGNVALGAGVGGLAGLILGGPVGGIAGILGGAAFGAGIGSAIAGSIDAAWDTYIRPALERLLANIATIFTVENLTAFGFDALNLVRGLGRKLADAITSEVFVGAVAGVAAAALLVTAAFTLGLVEGLANAVVEWSDLISTALEDAWNAIAPSFLPDPIVNAISAVLGTEATGALALVVGIPLGIAVVKSVIGGITGFGPALISGAGGLVGMIFGGKGEGGAKGRGNVPFDQDAKFRGFRTIGAKVAGAIAAGFLAFKFGEAAGEAGGTGAIILGILGGTITGAAIGTAIAPGIGTAIGAVLGGAASAVGAFFGAASREAENAKERVQEFVDALRGVTEVDLAPTVEDLIRQNLADLDTQEIEDWGQAWLDSGADIAQFADDVVAGTAEADRAAAEFVTSISDKLTVGLIEEGVPEAAAETFVSQFTSALATQAETGDFTSFGDLVSAAISTIDPAVLAAVGPNLVLILEEAFKNTDVTLGDVGNVFDFLQDQIDGVGTAFSEIDTEEAITQIDTVAEATARLTELLATDDTGRRIAEILDQEGATTEQSLQAISDLASEIEDKIEGTKSAIVDLLNVAVAPTTLGGAALDFVNQFEGIERQIEDAEITIPSINGVVDNIRVEAATEQVKADVGQQIVGMIEEGLDTGAITTTADAKRLLDQILANAEAADLTPEAEALIDSVVADIEAVLDTRGVEGLFGNLGTLLGDSLTLESTTTAITAGMTAVGTTITTAAGELDLNPAGAEIVSGLGAGIEAAAPELQASFNTTLALGFSGPSGAIAGGRASTNNPAGQAGIALGDSLAEGLASTTGQVAAAARAISIVVTVQFVALVSSMEAIGRNAGNALARGFLSQVRAAAAAAAAVASAVIQTTLSVLQISSPSKVFVGIGKEVGQGFIQGIKDAEGDMTNALADGLERAITVATDRARKAVDRAAAAQGIFDLLQPSILPGGTPASQIRQQRLQLTQEIGSFRGQLRQGAGEAFAQRPGIELGNAIREMQGILGDFNANFFDVTNEFREAQRQQAEINEFNRIEAKKRGGAKLTEAEKKILEGTRPAALTYQQRQILRGGALTLDARQFAGQQNIESITSALDAIRSYGQTALEQGRALPNVIANMKDFRNQLVNQATTLGFNKSQVQALVEQFGLSDKALQQFSKDLVSLDQKTVAGAANVQQFVEAAQQIRDFGSALFAAGANTTTVVAELKRYRDQLVDQAAAFGFNRNVLNALISELGLSNKDLDNFVNQLKAFDAEAKKAAATAKKAADEAAKREADEKRKEEEERAAANRPEVDPGGIPFPRVEQLHVHIPSGDPEAVALVAANRLAYAGLSSW